MYWLTLPYGGPLELERPSKKKMERKKKRLKSFKSSLLITYKWGKKQILALFYTRYFALTQQWHISEIHSIYFLSIGSKPRAQTKKVGQNQNTEICLQQNNISGLPKFGKIIKPQKYNKKVVLLSNLHAFSQE